VGFQFLQIHRCAFVAARKWTEIALARTFLHVLLIVGKLKLLRTLGARELEFS